MRTPNNWLDWSRAAFVFYYLGAVLYFTKYWVLRYREEKTLWNVEFGLTILTFVFFTWVVLWELFGVPMLWLKNF